jgi:hypothetical protein
MRTAYTNNSECSYYRVIARSNRPYPFPDLSTHASTGVEGITIVVSTGTRRRVSRVIVSQQYFNVLVCKIWTLDAHLNEATVSITRFIMHENVVEVILKDEAARKS